MSVYGAIIFALSATVFAIGQEKWNYFAGMLLLGVAWNFSFSAGTVMLTESYLVLLHILSFFVTRFLFFFAII